jgi:hypothetical protein
MGTTGLAKQAWPGWYTDAQLASEHAQSLSRQLAASVNAGRLAAAWLALHGTDVTTPASAPDEVAKARRKRRKRRRRGGGGRQQQQPPAQQQTAARQFLINQGVVAAITAIIMALLVQLWGAALAMGWASAVMVLGVGEIKGIEAALEALLRAGQSRIAGIVQTRVGRLERVLMAALRDGTSVDELARQISAILGSLASGLIVTRTEVNWASQFAAFIAYKIAGVKWIRWQTRNDGKVCARCRANQAASPVRLGTKFPSGDRHPPIHPHERCVILPSAPPKGQAMGKAA